MTRTEIVETARKYIGVPFTLRGRSPIFGLDCWGFLQVICYDLGVPCANIPRSQYTRIKFINAVFTSLKAAQFKEVKAPQAGDLLIKLSGICRGHTGILVGQSIIQSIDVRVQEISFVGRWVGFEFPGVK